MPPLLSDASGAVPPSDVVSSEASLRDIVSYFENKTPAIINRYGPGPRIHYHMGIVDESPPPHIPAGELRRILVNAQQRLLTYAAQAWGAAATLGGEVLDVGCGLGGGAIFLAEEFGAKVTAVTCVPSHAKLVSSFAKLAGVGPRVRPLLRNALDVPGKNRFDAVMAIDSSGYLSRKKWFRRLASLLRQGRQVFITDCFLGRTEYEEPYNCHWHTRIGTIEEYVNAADEAGFQVESVDDISSRTVHFWSTTLALIQLEEQGSAIDLERLEASRRAHTLLQRGLSDGGLQYALLSFRNSR